jgi:hypothetical protein
MQSYALQPVSLQQISLQAVACDCIPQPSEVQQQVIQILGRLAGVASSSFDRGILPHVGERRARCDLDPIP